MDSGQCSEAVLVKFNRNFQERQVFTCQQLTKEEDEEEQRNSHFYKLSMRFHKQTCDKH